MIPQPRHAGQWQGGRPGGPPPMGSVKQPGRPPMMTPGGAAAKMPPRPGFGGPQHYAKAPGHPPPGHQAPPPGPQGGDDLMLPFGIPPTRRAQEVRARAAHRNLVHPDLITATMSWATQKDGALLEKLQVHKSCELTQDEPCDFKEPTKIAGKKCNARALLVLGAAEGSGHILQRVEIVAAQCGLTKVPQAYGGLVKEISEDLAKKELTKLVAAQCGVDLTGVGWTKLVDFKYSPEKENPHTVFYIPDLSAQDELKFRNLVKEEEEEYEEEVEKEVEESEEEEEKEEEKKEGEEGEQKEGEEGEKKKEKKKKVIKEKVTKTRTKRTTEMQAKKYTLHQLLDLPLATNVDPNTADLLTAVDALDEWLKRECAKKAVTLLSQKGKEAKEKAEKLKEVEEQRSERKRKREDEASSRKKARDEAAAERKKVKDAEIAAAREETEQLKKKLAEQWEEEDQGKTDDDIKDDKAARDEILKEHDLQRAKRIRAAVDAEEEGKKAAEAEEAAAVKAAAEEDADLFKKEEEPREVEVDGVKMKRVTVRNQEHHDLFQCFDRPRGLHEMMLRRAQIPRQRMGRVITCVDKKLTTAEADDIASLCGTRVVPFFHYGSITDEQKLVKVEEEKKEEEKKEEEKEEEKKEEEEKAAGDGDAEMADGEKPAEGAAGGGDTEMAAPEEHADDLD